MPDAQPEPLQRLVRRQRAFQRAPVTPFTGFTGGDSPGMRGSPLDYQSAQDTAQGVDLSSIDPPTALRANRDIADTYGDDPTPTGLQQTEGGQRNPFMFASQIDQQPQISRPQMDCSSGVCRMVTPMSTMASEPLPAGVVLEPGQEYVKGSLREVTRQPAASAPRPAARPAPQDSGEFRPTAAAGLIDQRRGPVMPGSRPMEQVPTPGFPDPASLQAQSETEYNRSQGYIAERNAVGTVQSANRSTALLESANGASAISASIWAAKQRQVNAETRRADDADRAYLATPSGQQDLMLAQIGNPMVGRGMRVNMAANVMALRDSAENQRAAEAAKAAGVPATPAPEATRDWKYYEKEADKLVRHFDASQVAAQFAVIDEDHNFKANVLKAEIPDLEKKIALSHIKSTYNTLYPLYQGLPAEGRRALIANDLAGEYAGAFRFKYMQQPPAWLGKNPTQEAIDKAAVHSATQYASEHAAGLDAYYQSGMHPEDDPALNGIAPILDNDDDASSQLKSSGRFDAEPMF